MPALIRNGKLVGNPLAGGQVSKLDPALQRDTLDVLKKAEDGKRLSLDDLSTVMKARREAGATGGAPSLSDIIAQMKRVFGG